MAKNLLAAIGQCIYCGATEYAPGSSRTLAEEHIIPLGIGGTFILPEASCQKCERVTGRTESIALNNHLMGPRRHLGLRGRTPPSKAVKEIPVFVPHPDGDRKVMIPAEDHPAALFLLQLGNPPVLERLLGRWVEPPRPLGVFTKWFNYKDEVLRGKYGITEWATPALDFYSFGRMLAKIGHAHAVSTMGLGSFHPVLNRAILEDDRDSALVVPFIGGGPPRPPERALHTLKEGTATIAGIKFVVVEVRLFAQFGAPAYIVVVGTIGKRPAVLPTGIPVGGHVPHSMCRVTVPDQSDRPKPDR